MKIEKIPVEWKKNESLANLSLKMYFYKLIQQKCYVELNKKYARSIAITERKIIELFFNFKENHLIGCLMLIRFYFCLKIAQCIGLQKKKFLIEYLDHIDTIKLRFFSFWLFFTVIGKRSYSRLPLVDEII